MAHYEITVHPTAGTQETHLPPFEGPDDIREAIWTIGQRVAAHKPPFDLDDRVEVVTDNTAWRNPYRPAVGELIPAALHDKYPFAASTA